MQQLNVHDLVESPDSEFEMIADGGRARSVRFYECPDEIWETHRPTLYSSDPEYSALTLRRYTSRRVPGGMRKLTLYYEAESVSDTYSGIAPVPDTYSIDVSLSDEPLLAHDRYKDIDEEEKAALLLIFQGIEKNDDDEILVDLLKSTLSKEVYSKFLSGITHSREPAVIWTQRRSVATLSGLKKVGKIDSAPRAPDVVSGRNWLFIGMTGSQSEEGKNWIVDSKWELSASGGWDADLYD